MDDLRDNTNYAGGYHKVRFLFSLHSGSCTNFLCCECLNRGKGSFFHLYHVWVFLVRERRLGMERDQEKIKNWFPCLGVTVKEEETEE